MVLHQTKKFLHKPRKLSAIQERLLNEWQKIFSNDTPDQGYINIQNIQRMFTTQNQTNKQPNYKIEDLNMFPRNRTDDQQAYEKMLNIINHQGNANHNHEISPLPCQSGCIKQIRKKTVQARMCGKGAIVNCK